MLLTFLIGCTGAPTITSTADSEETVSSNENSASNPFGTLSTNSDYNIIVRWKDDGNTISNEISSGSELKIERNPFDVTKNIKSIKIDLNGHEIKYIEWYSNEEKIDGEMASQIRI